MSSFLTKKKDTRTYEEKISTEPIQTQRNKKYAVKVFERFCQEKYEKCSEEIIKEIIKIKQDQSRLKRLIVSFMGSESKKNTRIWGEKT